MKKVRFLSLILVVVFLGTCLLSACKTDKEESEVNTSTDESSNAIDIDADAGKIWKDEFAYGDITSADNVSKAYMYLNGAASEDYEAAPEENDVKLLFTGEDKTRIVNYTDGYMLTMPGAILSTDFSLSSLRSKYITENSVLTVTYEDQNPYGDNLDGWTIYLEEWLIRWIGSADYISQNNIMLARANQNTTELLPGYTVLTYDYFIRLASNMEYPIYNVAVIRKTDDYSHFYLLVMKSKNTGEEKLLAKTYEAFDEMIRSFSEFEMVGKHEDTTTEYKLTIPENWNEETKAYYNKLMTQDSVDWGWFTTTLTSDVNDIPARRTALEKIVSMHQAEDFFDYTYDIMPTYSAISWYGNSVSKFPAELAGEFAGGNGFNDKPVIQFTYQFTTNNNMVGQNITPMFDILRGQYDEIFRTLARGIKEYGHPVLFRLNNEMNTDWTSYCGMMTLLDPDVFIETWEYLYRIFDEEGVDNCIWIFNPIATSCPYSNWGAALNYMPSAEYVHVLGLTAYEMNNGTAINSFTTMYQDVYEQYNAYFADHPWVISEFACGAGGNKKYDYGTNEYNDTVLGRNIDKQAAFITEMFESFKKAGEPGYEVCDKIKGAIWFNCNDWVDIDGVSYVLNYLVFDDKDFQAESIKAFREGLAGMKK